MIHGGHFDFHCALVSFGGRVLSKRSLLQLLRLGAFCFLWVQSKHSLLSPWFDIAEGFKIHGYTGINLGIFMRFEYDGI